MKLKLFLPVIALVLILLAVLGFLAARNSCCFKENAILDNAKALEKTERTEDAIKEYEKIITEYPQSKKAADSYICLAELYERSGNLIEARDSYKKAMETYPDSEIVKNAKSRVEDLNMRILFSPLMDISSKSYEVQKGDSLAKIAKVFGTTVDLLKRSNNLEKDTIRQGARIKVVTAKFSVVVDKSQNTLILEQNGEVVKSYKVSTGLNNSTPVGNFKIVNKLTDPVWYAANSVVQPGSSDNILGTRWMGISKAGYGIHGTTDPDSLGKQVTAGCVRMRNEEVEELYSILPEGAEVTIVD
ncbi:MAG: L,D-transpeptidase family protein [Candidatus Omnitrophota bacterium]